MSRLVVNRECSHSGSPGSVNTKHAIFSVQDFKECMHLVDVVPTKVLSRESREFEETREEICGKVRPNARMSWPTMGKQGINPRVGTHAQ
jgi:hypothetical protein